MKRIFTMLLMGAVFAFGGCSYDDDDLWNKVNQIDDRLTTLEETVEGMNSEIGTMNGLISGLSGGQVITNVTTTATGYEITLSGSTTPLVINHGTNGTPGADAPVIGVKQYTDGLYYWTKTIGEVTGWLHEEAGVPTLPVTGKDGVPGVAPVMGVDGDGYWTVDGTRIEKTGGGYIKASGTDGQNGDSFFENVDASNEDYVVFTLKNGESFSISYGSSIRFEATGDGFPVDFYYGGQKNLTIKLKNITYVETLGKPEGWTISLVDDETLSVTAPVNYTSSIATEGSVSVIGLGNGGETLMAVQKVYVVDYTHPAGTFVVTEGNMSNQNGTIYYFDQYMKPHSGIYENANSGHAPGNVLQDMWMDNGKAIFLSQNGGRNGGDGQIVVCDAHTMKVEAGGIYNSLVFNRPEGTNNVGCPQHVAVVGNKAFVQYVDVAMESNSGIRVFDLSTGTLATDDIDGTYGAFASVGALKGRMWVSRGMVVAGLAKAVVFIDPVTEAVVKRVDFGGQVKGLAKGADGNFHVAVSGDFEGAPGYGTPTPDGARIVGLDHDGEQIYEYTLNVKLPIQSYQPTVNMCASFTQPHIYLLTGDAFSITSADRFDYRTKTFESGFVSLGGYDAIYGYMGVHPVNERLFVNQSISYMSTRISIYDTASPAAPQKVYNYSEASPAGTDFAYRFTTEFINK